jgi:hypothetical protein
VVDQSDAEDLGGVGKVLGERLVIGTGARLAARVGVKHEDGGGADEESLFEDLAGLDSDAVQSSAVDLTVAEKCAGVAEKQGSEDLLIADAIAQTEVASHVLQTAERIVLWDALRGEAAGELLGGKKPRAVQGTQGGGGPRAAGKEAEELASVELQQIAGALHIDAKEGDEKLLIGQRRGAAAQDPLLRCLLGGLPPEIPTSPCLVA